MITAEWRDMHGDFQRGRDNEIKKRTSCAGNANSTTDSPPSLGSHKENG